MTTPLVSIVIRTKNEERWIAHCLEAILKQEIGDFEIILVDNASTDHTLAIAQRFPLAAIVTIDRYLPGLALNMGIRRSSGRYIVCLSAHCIPQNERWLSSLLAGFENDHVAGVYGRQLPLPYSTSVDKRDLLTIFGADRRVQLKDYFFHNANSMLRREMWERFPFDEAATNLEDRIWGKAVIDAGYRLVYEPEAAVYHQHGINQNNDPERARGVAAILEAVEADIAATLPAFLRPENSKVAAIVPVLGELRTLYGRDLFSELLAELRTSRYVHSITAISENPKVRALAEAAGVRFLTRPEHLSAADKTLGDVLAYALREVEAAGEYPESVLFANYLYPFRPQNLFDELVLEARWKGLETVFPGYVDYSDHWLIDGDGNFQRVSESPRQGGGAPRVYRSLYGLGCVVSAAVVRQGLLVGNQVGILPVRDHIFTLRLTDAPPEPRAFAEADPTSPLSQTQIFLKEFRP